MGSLGASAGSLGIRLVCARDCFPSSTEGVLLWGPAILTKDGTSEDRRQEKRRETKTDN